LYIAAAIISIIFGLRSFSEADGVIEESLSIIIPAIFCILLYKMNQAKNRREMQEQKVHKEQAEKQNKINGEIEKAQSDFAFGPLSAKIIGGSGYTFVKNQPINLGISASSLIILKKETLERIEINFDGINELEISGPGTVTTSAGVVGGGFGLEGFLKGAVAASIINAATTKSSTNTFIRVLSKTGEIYLHTTEMEPAILKMNFSPAFVSLANRSKRATANSGVGIAEEIERHQKLLKDGTISQEEFDTAKKKIIA